MPSRQANVLLNVISSFGEKKKKGPKGSISWCVLSSDDVFLLSLIRSSWVSQEVETEGASARVYSVDGS